MFVPNQYFYSFRQLNAMNVFNSLVCENSQRTRFTKEEDERLRHLVSYQDPPNWNDIARYMHHRTARQCRERYNNYLRPTLVNGPWSEEENFLLTSLYEKYGPKWSLIAQSFNGRSAVNVKNHHSSLVSQSMVKNRSNRVIQSQEKQKIDNFITNNENDSRIANQEKSSKVENKQNDGHENEEHSFDNMFANFQNEEDFLWSSSLVPSADDNLMAF